MVIYCNTDYSIEIALTSNTLKYDKYPITPEIVRKCTCLLPNKFNVSPYGLSKGLLKNL